MASQVPQMASGQGPKMSSQESKLTTQQPVTTTTPLTLSFKYSNRVLLKTILKRRDGGMGLVDVRMVIGGWVRSSKEVKKEPLPPPTPQPHATDGPGSSPEPKDVSCVEILQTRIPLFRSIVKILGGGGCGGGGSGANYPVREKVEPVIQRLPSSSKVYWLVSDGSCIESLQVMVDSSIVSPTQLLPIGTCILVEGMLCKASEQGKHNIELKVEKILHTGMADPDKYPLSKKRLPLESLRDCPHLRPRTNTVASVMRIRSALTFATHTFFENNGFQYVQVPIITTTDSEGFSEKFQVTTLFSKAGKKEDPNATKNTEGVTLEIVKTAIKDKNKLVQELQRSDSNREALAAAVLDLQKANQLASQLEAKEKQKSVTSMKLDKVNFSEDFFSCQTYLTVSGLLHLESYACAVGNVYSFGPRFRADRRETAKHVAEMWMVEVEMAFSQLEDAMNCAGDYFQFLCKWILEKCSEDLNFLMKRVDKTSTDRLRSMISSSLERVSYMEAVEILGKVTDRIFETKLVWGIALKEEHLSYLADEIYKRPVVVYNYPKEIKPFYVRLNNDGKTVAAFDMVVPKVGTLITGSQNEERIDMLHTRIKELGLPTEQYEWYLDLRRHGTVQHCGFSLGFDLMVLFTTGLPDARDAIPFPRGFGKANN